VRRTRQELERVNQLMEAAHDPAHAPEERALALHDARRATKRARYAVEPLRAVYGDAAATLTTRLKALQTALGEHQDTVVTRDYLHALVQETRPPLDPAAALAAGALIERESRAAEEYDLQAEDAWQKVARSPRLG
jgi:CHAD domain-containing protein